MHMMSHLLDDVNEVRASDFVTSTSSDAVCNDNAPTKDKKPRWTSSEKKSRKQRVTTAVQQQQQQQQQTIDEHQLSQKRIKKMNRLRVANETRPIVRLIASAQKVLYTGSVNFVNYSSNELLKALDSDDNCLDKNDHSNTTNSSSTNNNILTKIQIVTTCCGGVNHVDSSLTIPQIQVKPLLVLDLNGILCHRIRPKKEIPEVLSHRPEICFRPILAHIANTNIIARTGLHTFLDYLSQHFCLAIWTSARSKNASALVKILIPDTIKERLLFTWAQHDCQSVVNDPITNDTTFIKDLQKVWDAYPLWNSNNTLLVDDSPAKCISWQENAVHPPAMNGLKPEAIQTIRMNHSDFSSTTASSSSSWMSDEENANQQNIFFEGLVDHWTKNTVVHEWDHECEDVIVTHHTTTQVSYLRQHACKHMGWTNK